MITDRHGAPFLYCHGLPGGAAELQLAECALPVLDRSVSNAPNVLSQQFSFTPVHLVGFSLGAALALRLAAALPDRVARLTLISAAAPLELGDFLPDMAGRAVFRAARHPALFRTLTAAQSLMVQIAPSLIARQLVATCDASDQALLGAECLRFAAALKEGYGVNRGAYLREVTAYVEPWAAGLSDVHCPVILHHGETDRWAPFAMGNALAAILPSAEFTSHPGLGHYSTLRAVLATLSA